MTSITKKKCSKCSEEKPLTEFYKQKDCKDGRRSECILCNKAASKARREGSKDKERERYDRWKRVNYGKLLDYQQGYRKLNVEKLNEYKLKWAYSNKEKIKTANRKWQLGNSESVLANRHRRRARERGLVNDWTREQAEEVLTYFNGGCALTGEKEDLHWEHAIPLSVGHLGTQPGNMFPLKAKLNLSKNSKNIFEWFGSNQERFNLSQERFESLINWLALQNGVTTEEYRDYVYWCHENPFSIDDLKKLD